MQRFHKYSYCEPILSAQHHRLTCIVVTKLIKIEVSVNPKKLQSVTPRQIRWKWTATQWALCHRPKHRWPWWRWTRKRRREVHLTICRPHPMKSEYCLTVITWIEMIFWDYTVNHMHKSATQKSSLPIIGLIRANL